MKILQVRDAWWGKRRVGGEEWIVSFFPLQLLAQSILINHSAGDSSICTHAGVSCGPTVTVKRPYPVKFPLVKNQSVSGQSSQWGCLPPPLPFSHQSKR